jgi:hypothetical protein
MKHSEDLSLYVNDYFIIFKPSISTHKRCYNILGMNRNFMSMLNDSLNGLWQRTIIFLKYDQIIYQVALEVWPTRVPTEVDN